MRKKLFHRPAVCLAVFIIAAAALGAPKTAPKAAAFGTVLFDTADLTRTATVVDGKIAHIIVYKGALSDKERKGVEAMLGARYDIRVKSK